MAWYVCMHACSYICDKICFLRMLSHVLLMNLLVSALMLWKHRQAISISPKVQQSQLEKWRPAAMRRWPEAFPVLVHRKHSNRSNLELQISSEDRHGTPTWIMFVFGGVGTWWIQGYRLSTLKSVELIGWRNRSNSFQIDGSVASSSDVVFRLKDEMHRVQVSIISILFHLLPSPIVLKRLNFARSQSNPPPQKKKQLHAIEMRQGCAEAGGECKAGEAWSRTCTWRILPTADVTLPPMIIEVENLEGVIFHFMGERVYKCLDFKIC